MKPKSSLVGLATLLFFLFLSCSKGSLSESQSQSKVPAKSNKRPAPVIVKDPVATNGRYPTDLSLAELTNNGDGSFTGWLGGMAVRFSDFMYEIDYDANGNPLAPQEGQPAWPQSIGPEPGVTTLSQFNCLTFITNPNAPDNQVTVQNHCIYQGTFYSAGAGLNSYFNTVYTNWSNYQTAIYNWHDPSSPSYHVGPMPTQPSAPLITPYILQDYHATGATTQLWSARFGVYSYDPVNGITFGMDAQ